MRRIALVLALLAGGLFAFNINNPGILRDLLEDFASHFPSQTPRPRVKPQPSAALAQRLAAKGLRYGQPVFIRIIKQSSELELWMGGDPDQQPAQAPGPNPGGAWTLLHTYPICKWSGALGPKVKEGDRQAPEGFYAIRQTSLNPYSRNHLAFDLGFPNAYDRAHGRTGTFLMVHGNCRSIGCYAMTNQGIDEIYRLVEEALRAGQPSVPVHAFPFRMTDANMKKRRFDRWSPYWANLKDGWDRFEASRQPPPVFACGQTYKFGDQSNSGDCAPIGEAQDRPFLNKS
jgi:murein L,D-transpeptidase YafK